MKQDMVKLANTYGFNVYYCGDSIIREVYEINCFGVIKKAYQTEENIEDAIFISRDLKGENVRFLIALLLSHYEIDNKPYDYFYMINTLEQIANEKPEITKMAHNMMNKEVENKILIFRKNK